MHTPCSSADFPFSHEEGDEGQKVAWEIIIETERANRVAPGAPTEDGWGWDVDHRIESLQFTRAREGGPRAALPYVVLWGDHRTQWAIRMKGRKVVLFRNPRAMCHQKQTEV